MLLTKYTCYLLWDTVSYPYC